VGPHIPSTVVSSYKVQPICRAKVGLNAPEIEDLRISEAPYGARLSDNCSQASSWVQSSVAIYFKELSVYKLRPRAFEFMLLRQRAHTAVNPMMIGTGQIHCSVGKYPVKINAAGKNVAVSMNT
jgi:hypothetical protein